MQQAQSDESSTIFVTGDLNIDNVVTGVELGKISRVVSHPLVVGGSAYNAAIAFKDAGFRPILFGKVGNDVGGQLILSSLREHRIETIIACSATKPTCTCNIIYFQGADHLRAIYYQGDNANDYDVVSLRLGLEQAMLHEKDFVFSPLHIYDQTNWDKQHCHAFFGEMHASKARLIVDIVPHTIYDVLNGEDFKKIIGEHVFMIIGEYHTFKNLITPGTVVRGDTPSEDDCKQIARYFGAEYCLCRFGIGDISFEQIIKRTHDGDIIVGAVHETGYASLEDDRIKRGFGDRLTADTLNQIMRSEYLA